MSEIARCFYNILPCLNHVKMLANKGIMGVSSKIDAPIFVFLKYFLYLCSEGE